MNRGEEGTRHALLLSFHYPPMLGPASQRAASFARHLPEHGWHPIVITVGEGHYHRDERHRPPAVPTVRTRSPEPSRLLRPFRASNIETSGDGAVVVTEAGAKPALGWARRAVRDYIYLPDGQVLWIPFAVRAIRRVVESLPGPTVLVSTSVPYSAHLAALTATRRLDLPWVAEFRDPWSQVDQTIRPRSRVRRAVDRALEARVVQGASAVVVTTDLTRHAMTSLYPELGDTDVCVVRNGFDEVTAPALPPPPAGAPLELIQAGSVPEDVPLEPLLRGIDSVARRYPDSVRLRVFAHPARWQSSAAAVDNPRWLELEGLVPPDEARAAMAAASANVLLRPGGSHRQYVAAKLMDYLGARRPVLGIVDPSGEMASLGRDYGDMRIVPTYEVEAVAAAVEQLLAQQRAGALTGKVEPRRPLAEITRRAQAGRLAALLDSLA